MLLKYSTVNTQCGTSIAKKRCHSTEINIIVLLNDIPWQIQYNEMGISKRRSNPTTHPKRIETVKETHVSEIHLLPHSNLFYQHVAIKIP
jgi:hypothetical protein